MNPTNTPSAQESLYAQYVALLSYAKYIQDIPFSSKSYPTVYQAYLTACLQLAEDTKPYTDAREQIVYLQGRIDQLIMCAQRLYNLDLTTLTIAAL